MRARPGVRVTVTRTRSRPGETVCTECHSGWRPLGRSVRGEGGTSGGARVVRAAPPGAPGIPSTDSQLVFSPGGCAPGPGPVSESGPGQLDNHHDHQAGTRTRNWNTGDGRDKASEESALGRDDSESSEGQAIGREEGDSDGRGGELLCAAAGAEPGLARPQ